MESSTRPDSLHTSAREAPGVEGLVKFYRPLPLAVPVVVCVVCLVCAGVSLLQALGWNKASRFHVWSESSLVVTKLLRNRASGIPRASNISPQTKKSNHTHLLQCFS